MTNDEQIKALEELHESVKVLVNKHILPATHIQISWNEAERIVAFRDKEKGMVYIKGEKNEAK